jgi:uncharacterized protein
MTAAAPRLDSRLLPLLARLREATGLRGKLDIQLASRIFPRAVNTERGLIHNGDDAAAIPDENGYTLIAAEGIAPWFARDDPWFAGFCSVMVNLSDIAAMGGRALAIVDVLFAGAQMDNERILTGMRDASEVFQVPVVGGHTSRIQEDSALAAAVVGKAKKLITSFDARPGQKLFYAVDLRGAYRGTLNFNAATHKSASRLRENMALLPQLAEAGLVSAGKDVSMAGLLGTVAMLSESSGTGCLVDLSRVPRPESVDLQRWLLSFPSYGYVLSVQPEHAEEVEQRFRLQEIACAEIGACTEEEGVRVRFEEEVGTFWSAKESLTGFGPAGPRALMPNTAHGTPGGSV